MSHIAMYIRAISLNVTFLVFLKNHEYDKNYYYYII